VVRRVAVIVIAVLIGAAAPARAWCEATCLVATQDAKPHCPSHDATTGLGISAADSADCPIVETARSITSARIELKSTAITVLSVQFAVTFDPIRIVAASHHVTTVFQRHTPLRI
jgi:hypothetical protein